MFLKEKRCKYNALLLEPNLTPGKAKEFEFLKFNHPKPVHWFGVIKLGKTLILGQN